MFSVDNNGQYPGAAGTVQPTYAANGQQPYMNAQPLCPAVNTNTYLGTASVFSQNPPGFIVACNDGTGNHVAAGVGANSPAYASDAGGMRVYALADTNVDDGAGTGALQIDWLAPAP